MKKRNNKIKFLVVAGARPNFIKIAPLFFEFKRHKNIKPILVHTGQHYNFEMSKIFFKELKIPTPDYNLGVGSGSHAWQTAKIMEKLEPILIKEKPNLVIVVGDVNSTLSGAITSAKLNIPLAHIEAGLRSYDKKMPEEINRVLTDHISEFLFVTSKLDKNNLIKEGIDKQKIFIVGNIMTDILLKVKNKNSDKILNKFSLKKQNFGILTLHRPENTDNKERLKELLEKLRKLSKKISIIFPIHPRTKKMIKVFGLERLLRKAPNLILIPPLSYLEMIALMKNAKLVLTDSGGVQHETTVLKVPCLTLRENTEWLITLMRGTNLVVGISKEKIIRETLKIITGNRKRVKRIKYWDGKTAKRILKILINKINGK